MLKIVVTVANFASKAHIGGDTERDSYIIDIPTQNIPKRIKEHFERIKEGKPVYQTLSFSILDEEAQ